MSDTRPFMHAAGRRCPGRPLHGVGFESHIICWAGGTSHEGVMWLLGELQKRNLEVHISEFDVSPFGGSNGALPHGITDPTPIDPFVAAFRAAIHS